MEDFRWTILWNVEVPIPNLLTHTMVEEVVGKDGRKTRKH